MRAQVRRRILSLMVAVVGLQPRDTASVTRGEALYLVVENSVAIVVDRGLETHPIADGNACAGPASSLASILRNRQTIGSPCENTICATAKSDRPTRVTADDGV